MECFGLQFGHSVGLFLHERPIISRLNSLDHPSSSRRAWSSRSRRTARPRTAISAARIEEEVVVTADGPQVITRFPSRRAVRRQRVLMATDGDAPTPAPPTVEVRPRACTGRWSSAGCSRRARRSCSSRASSAARPTSASARRRSRPGSPRRCATTTTRSARTAATTTPWPAACRWRRSSPSCSAARPGCSAARAARCTSPASSTA